MNWMFRSAILVSWATIFLVPPYIYYRDRIRERQRLQSPVYFFDQMEFMKNAVDDNPKYHQINDVDPAIQNHLFCRLRPISPTSSLFGSISIENNRVVKVERSNHSLDNMLVSIYEYGYLMEGRDSFGRRIHALGIFSEDLPSMSEFISKSVVGRSIVVENRDREILAAGIIARV